MSIEAIAAIEYETLILSRHLAELPGRSRRSRGILDQSAYALLNLLEATGPASIGQLLSITGLDASTLNRQTAAIVRDGYAERISDPAGGIARKFRITRAGRTALADERSASHAALRLLLAGWDGDDRSAFAALLRRFNEEIEVRTGLGWPRDHRYATPGIRETEEKSA